MESGEKPEVDLMWKEKIRHDCGTRRYAQTCPSGERGCVPLPFVLNKLSATAQNTNTSCGQIFEHQDLDIWDSFPHQHLRKHIVFTRITNGIARCQNGDLAAAPRPSELPRNINTVAS